VTRSTPAPPVRDAAADAEDEAASPTLASCFEPSRVTQLKTVRDPSVVWDGDVVVDAKHRHYDPEMLAERTTPPAAAPSKADRLSSGERIVSSGDTLAAGTRWSLPLREGEKLERVEAGRWIVIRTPVTTTNGTGPVDALRVIDGVTGSADAKHYVDVSADFALASSAHDLGIVVWNMATRTSVYTTQDACVAGGLMQWALSRRFLRCESNRFGVALRDLRSGKEYALDQSSSLSPDETYTVTSPGRGWGGNTLSEDTVSYTNLDTGLAVTLTKDVPPVTESTPTPGTTVPVVFCGTGRLFAIVGRHKLSVHRGFDAALLAQAPAMPGGVLLFSESGHYVMHKRAGSATVFRLDP
jgi:hypothetical protein